MGFIDNEKEVDRYLSQYEVQPGASPEVPLDEQHSELTNGTRAIIKNLAVNPQVAADYLQQQGFIVGTHLGGHDFSIKKPGEKQWRRVDPTSMEIQDITDVLGDITSMIGTGVGATVGVPIGASITAPTGPGAIAGGIGSGIAGGAVGAGLTEGLKGLLGSATTNLRQNVISDTGQAALIEAMGGAIGGAVAPVAGMALKGVGQLLGKGLSAAAETQVGQKVVQAGKKVAQGLQVPARAPAALWEAATLDEGGKIAKRETIKGLQSLLAANSTEEPAKVVQKSLGKELTESYREKIARPLIGMDQVRKMAERVRGSVFEKAEPKTKELLKELSFLEKTFLPALKEEKTQVSKILSPGQKALPKAEPLVSSVDMGLLKTHIKTIRGLLDKGPQKGRTVRIVEDLNEAIDEFGNFIQTAKSLAGKTTSGVEDLLPEEQIMKMAPEWSTLSKTLSDINRRIYKSEGLPGGVSSTVVRTATLPLLYGGGYAAGSGTLTGAAGALGGAWALGKGIEKGVPAAMKSLSKLDWLQPMKKTGAAGAAYGQQSGKNREIINKDEVGSLITNLGQMLSDKPELLTQWSIKAPPDLKQEMDKVSQAQTRDEYRVGVFNLTQNPKFRQYMFGVAFGKKENK